MPGQGSAPRPAPAAERAPAAGPPRAGDALDRLAALASRLLGSPTAQVSLTTDVQTIVGGAGLPPGWDRREEALDDSLCAVTVASAAPLVVPDARLDERVADRPPVVSGLVGAYLGVPLTGGEGRVVGALCVIDSHPRAWSDADVRVLEQLAAAVVAELELSALSTEVDSTRLRWELAVDAAGMGTFDLDVRSGRLRWDGRLLELFGCDDASFDGTVTALSRRLDPQDLPRVSAEVRGALAVCGEVDLEFRVLPSSGGSRWLQARGRALCDEDGAPSRLIGAAYDVTARRESDAGVTRVLEAMSAAFYSLDRDWRFTYVNAEAERLLGRDRGELVGASIWDAFPATVGSVFEEHYRAAASTGEPQAFEAHYPAPLDGWFEARVWPGPDGLGVYFLDVTARRRLEEQATRTAARLALVAEVSAELSGTLDTATAVQRLAEIVVPGLADWSIVTLLDEDGRPEHLGSWHVDPAARPVLERYARARAEDLVQVPVAARSLGSGRALLIPADAAAVVAPTLPPGRARDAFLELAPESAAAVPLKGRGRILGLLSLAGGPSSNHLVEGFAVAEDVAAHAGLALDNMRLYDQQRRLAEGLQRSLLTAPPQPDHTQIVVRYRPAAETAQVGGDWYDAFMQSDGATVVVIGDVVGHDAAAAAAMGQLRGLLRGIAFHSGAGPAAVLSGLDAAMAGLSVETTATAVVARIEQDPAQLARSTATVRWSNAGHPPPVLVTADGAVTALGAEPAAGADLLLGIDPGADRVESVVELAHDATLLLYTDGLVERRDQGLDEGIRLLEEALRELAGAPLEEICDALLVRLVPSRSEDDVALVAVRLHPQDGPRPAEAGPERVPPGVPGHP